MTLLHDKLSRERYEDLKGAMYAPKNPDGGEYKIDKDYCQDMCKDAKEMDQLVEEMRECDTSKRSKVCGYDVALRISKLEEALRKTALRKEEE